MFVGVVGYEAIMNELTDVGAIALSMIAAQVQVDYPNGDAFLVEMGSNFVLAI